LAVERVGGHNGALQRQQFQQLRHCGDLVGLGVGGEAPGTSTPSMGSAALAAMGRQPG
jgi:hypothetical protein